MNNRQKIGNGALNYSVEKEYSGFCEFFLKGTVSMQGCEQNWEDICMDH